TPSPPHRLCEGHGTTRTEISRRRRGADPLCARTEYIRFAGRQDLQQPAKGRGDPGADRNTPAAASRRVTLPDPPLRLSADCRKGPRCRPTICQDRSGSATCPAYAVTHFHARRSLERI